MAVPVYLIGDNSLQPFIGAFRTVVDGAHCWVRAYGRVAHTAGLREAYLPARRLEAAVTKAAKQSLREKNRHLILHNIWQELQHLSPDQLGPEKGADLCLLLSVGDGQGVDLAAVGLSGLWGRLPGQKRWIAIVPQEHPLLGNPGVPKQRLGSLTLNKPPMCALGMPFFSTDSLPSARELSRRVGANL